MKFAEFIGYKLMNIIVNNILSLINFWYVLPRDMVKANIYLSNLLQNKVFQCTSFFPY